MAFSSIDSQHVRHLAHELVRKLEEIQPVTAFSHPPDWVYPRLAAALDDCLAALRMLNLDGPDNRLPSSELWNVAGHLLSRGWLQNRARTKPRGYAGDYEMLARIYEHRLCDDPLGRLFDRYFQDQAAPQAVRNRMSMMTDRIEQAALATYQSPHTNHRSIRIAIVGSAFGLEVHDAMVRLDQATRERLHVTLLDLDPAVIDFARGQLSDLLPFHRLTATSANLFRLPDRPQSVAVLEGADLMFCPGLFDYLDDKAAVAMLRTLFQQVAPGGQLIVFQFAPQNPTRAYMEWFGNWYLTYRDAAQLKQLVGSAGLSGAIVTFGAEPLGIDLYSIVTRA